MSVAQRNETSHRGLAIGYGVTPGTFRARREMQPDQAQTAGKLVVTSRAPFTARKTRAALRKAVSRARITRPGFRSVFVVEANRNRSVAPRVVEDVTPIRGVHQIDAEPLGRLAKCADLVAGRRRQEQDARHWVRPAAAAPDSAPRSSTRARSNTRRPFEPRRAAASAPPCPPVRAPAR